MAGPWWSWPGQASDDPSVADLRARPLWLRWRSRARIERWEAVVTAALANGEPEIALQALQQLTGNLHWHRPVETLLFHRSSRPTDLRVQIALLRGIAAGNSFRPHHRAYAQVSLAYRAAETGDLDLAQALVPLLETEATTLLADPASLRCRRRNRENRLKRLISCRTALYHLYLLLDQPWQLAAIAGWAHGLLPRLDFNRLPADVVLRLMSNYARCLCLQAPLAAPPGLPVPLVLLRRDLERLEQEAGRPRHRRSRAREDHLGFLRQLVAALDHPLPMATEGRSIAGADPLPPLAEDLLIVDTPLLRRCIAEYWRQAGQPPAAWPVL